MTSPATPAPAHTDLYLDGRIHSSASPDATAMAVVDGRVVWVGEDRTARALHPDATVVDLGGAFVAPAFVDTHVHVTAHGLALTGLDLSDTRSRDELLDRVRRYAASHDDAVVWGAGWDESRWADDTPPTTDELDTAAPGRAVYLTRVDAHSAAASTPLRRAAFDAGTDVPGFVPDGPLTAQAHHRVREQARALLDDAQADRARRASLDAAAAAGIVAVHECGGPDIGGRDDFAAVLGLDHGVEVRGYWGEAVTDPDAAAALLADTGAHSLGGDLFVDGSLGSHTAWLGEPYRDAPGTGRSYLDRDTIAAHVAACTAAGIQAGFHAIGDAAVTAVVDGIGDVVDRLGGPAVARCGHRVEHLEMVTADQARRLASFGVTASVQPGFDAAWGGPDGLYATRLGAARAATLNPFATIAATGIGLAFGSDAPVTPVAPWAMLRAAVHHRTDGSGLSPRAAFAAATRGAWRAGGVRDGVAGTLDAGAPASFAVWETGELAVTAAQDGVQRWSTDPRSRVAPLPSLEPDADDPVLLFSVHRGRPVYTR